MLHYNLRMINIAIVEDDNKAAALLQGYLNDYRKAHGEAFEIKRFSDAVSFLTNYRPDYDIIFMDIEMPHLTGMEAAYELRKVDRNVVLIFVTGMAQFAVKGYEVDALDYIVKPLGYKNFSLKLQKALNIVKSNEQVELVINQAGGMRRISTREIYYIEVLGHKLNYYMQNEVFSGYGSLAKLSEKLTSYHFMRCNNCYLVNPKHIISVEKLDVTMRNGVKLQISHPRKKTFMSELADWLGCGNFI